MDRREFIHTSALAAGASSAGAWAAGTKSRVVEVHRPGVVGEGYRPDAAATQQMLDRGMYALTGEIRRRDQWSCFVNPSDVVGLKVNGLGGPHLCTKRELIRAVIQGLIEAGVEENHIIVWDNAGAHINAIGMGVNTGDTGVRVYGSDMAGIGYDQRQTDFGPGATRLSRIFSEQITALINLPLIKDHSTVGSTVSLKNISHGITDNPGAHHDERCEPHIAAINDLPAVREKHRLVVVDGLIGCYEGGPGYRPEWTHAYESVLVSEDPVAADAVCTAHIEAIRRQKGLPSLEEDGRPASYLAAAGTRGLGCHDRAGIRHEVLDG